MKPGPKPRAGERYSSGDLKPQPDRGTIQLRDRRAVLVGSDKADDKRAGYPLGILYLRGLLKSADHAAGLRYAALHAIVWGQRTPKSHLADMIAGITGGIASVDSADREKRLIRAGHELGEANAAVLGLGSRRPYDMLQNIAVYERELRFMDTSRSRGSGAWAADQRDLEALQSATDALAQHWGMGHYGKQAAN